MTKTLKIAAIADIIIDICLIGSLIYVSSNNHKLKEENQLLKNEAIEMEELLINKNHYIEHLENIVISVEDQLYK